ncbi:9201_t:CDS:2, partial [Dentiscutata erythropus]
LRNTWIKAWFIDLFIIWIIFTEKALSDDKLPIEEYISSFLLIVLKNHLEALYQSLVPSFHQSLIPSFHQSFVPSFHQSL